MLYDAGHLIKVTLVYSACFLVVKESVVYVHLG